MRLCLRRGAAVLDALVRTNGEQTSGYGEDPHCERARALIRQLCRRPDAAVHFVTGGTPGQSDGDCSGAQAV